MSGPASQLPGPPGGHSPANRPSPTQHRAHLVAAGLLALSWLAAAPEASAAGPTATVQIENFTFTPAQLSIEAGTTVTWINHDDIPHLVAASDKAFRSPPLDTDESFSFTFSTPGTFDYFCALHPRMTGTIQVTAKAK
ncbi:MAG: cupredoxin family copper-binding protein [Candidatus Kaistia colombiensis]|nr:MAG: cupredoxin family copper-binding protein [Kaistia sp.]